MWGYSGKMAIYEGVGPYQTQNLPEPCLWTSQTPELWETNLLLIRHSMSGYFVIAAWVDQDNFKPQFCCFSSMFFQNTGCSGLLLCDSVFCPPAPSRLEHWGRFNHSWLLFVCVNGSEPINNCPFDDCLWTLLSFLMLLTNTSVAVTTYKLWPLPTCHLPTCLTLFSCSSCSRYTGLFLVPRSTIFFPVSGLSYMLFLKSFSAVINPFSCRSNLSLLVLADSHSLLRSL